MTGSSSPGVPPRRDGAVGTRSVGGNRGSDVRGRHSTSGTGTGGTGHSAGTSGVGGTSGGKGLFVSALIAVLVLSLGVTPTAEALYSAQGPTDTEMARRSSMAATTTTLTKAQALLSDKVHGSLAPAGTPSLTATVGTLRAQAAALKSAAPVPHPGERNTRDGTGTGDGTEAKPPATLPVLTPSSLIQQLAAAGKQSVRGALTADGPMARLLASVGASQLVHARSLAASLGLAQPSSFALPPADPAPGAPPPCSSTLTPKSGVNEDQALLAARDAEQKAVYAYQVAATRFSEPRYGEAVSLLRGHEKSLRAIDALLATRCLPTSSVVPGFALDKRFTDAPASALQSLEEDLTVVYGDLIAVSATSAAAVAGNADNVAADGPDARSTGIGAARHLAVERMALAVENLEAWGGTVPALPGITEAPDPN